MSTPSRIVSLLPSATEILCALELQDKLVGISHECDYPPEITSLPAVTHSHIASDISSAEIDAQVREHLGENSALYGLDEPLLQKLAPELIVTQALCDVCAVAASDVEKAACGLAQVAEVVNLEPSVLQDVFDTIIAVGNVTGVAEKAQQVVTELQSRVDAVRTRTATIAEPDKPKVVMLEWLDPPFNAGHWTPELVEYAGGIDLLGGKGQSSTTISWNAVREANPDYLIMACCGFDIERTLQDVKLVQQESWWDQLKAVANNNVFVIDGNQYFNRPGPRLVDSLEVLAHVLHPEVHPLPDGLQSAFVTATRPNAG